MIAIGIDPGADDHGVVVLSTASFGASRERPCFVQRPEVGASVEDIGTWVGIWEPAVVVCEWITSYGMAVGASVFDTCRQVGRIEQVCWSRHVAFDLIPRRDVKLAVCGSCRAKDANVRQALIDIYPRTGGGKTPQVGTKAAPGPLYGMKSHTWPALAVVVAWLRLHHMDRPRP